MAKRQLRIKQQDLVKRADRWLGKTLSVVLQSGAVSEVLTQSLKAGVLIGNDATGLKHKFQIADIKEIILNFPVAEHAQTSAD